MDFNQTQPDSYDNRPPVTPPRINALAIASLVMGILASLTLCTIYLPFIFGSLSIIFALLSKGYQKRMPGPSIAGTVISISGILLSLITIVTTLFVLFTNPDIYDEYKKQLNTILEQQYGMTYDEIMGEYEDALSPYAQ